MDGEDGQHHETEGARRMRVALQRGGLLLLAGMLVQFLVEPGQPAWGTYENLGALAGACVVALEGLRLLVEAVRWRL